jgi:cell division protein ZapA (FtsZ GTPase activity inhibitor)
MADQSSVSVKIYGQEYKIAGDKPRDYIIKVADLVDETMNDIAEAGGSNSVAGLAVLTAVNIADKLFTTEESVNAVDQEKEDLRKDVEHYTQLWDEAKESFLQTKSDTQAILESKDLLQQKINDSAIKNENLLRSLDEQSQKISKLEATIEALNARLRQAGEGSAANVDQIKDLEDKYKEIEGNYFELQMENIQLKGDLERFKRQSDEDDYPV